MALGVHAELSKYHNTQQHELDQLTSLQVLNSAEAKRLQQLQSVLSMPLCLSDTALAVSASSLEGIDELHAALVEVAFDEDAFPNFGTSQPGSYAAIHRKLLRAHPSESSLTWGEMQESAASHSAFDCAQLQVGFVNYMLSSAVSEESESEEEEEPEQEDCSALIVGSLHCQVGDQGTFEACRVELSRAGNLQITGSPVWKDAVIDLAKAGTVVGEPKTRHKDRPFCVRVDSVSPKKRKFLLDTGNATDQQAWLRVLRTAAGSVAATTVDVYRSYTFSVSFEEEELRTFTLRHSAAKVAHAQVSSAAGQLLGQLDFPAARFGDSVRDFDHDEENWKRRAEEMREYYQQLLRKHDVVSHAVLTSTMGFALAELEEKHSRIARKAREDPELLRRAMLYHTITGDVLRPKLEQGKAGIGGDRVFLQPQLLIDLLKELVRHDLFAQVQQASLAKRGRTCTREGFRHQVLHQGRTSTVMCCWQPRICS